MRPSHWDGAENDVAATFLGQFAHGVIRFLLGEFFRLAPSSISVYAAVYLFGAACAQLGAALVVTARSPPILTINLDGSGPGSDDATDGEIPRHAS